MTDIDLRSEGQRLARPCTYLVASGHDHAAVWGGTGVAPSPGPQFRHWVTVDARFLPARFEAGCVSVFSNEEDGESGAVVFTPGARLSSSMDGTPLFAKAAKSLPPLQGLLPFASAGLCTWLADNGWDSESGDDPRFTELECAREYEAAYQAQLPLYSGGAHAVIGGWHFPWPDGDWADLAARRLLLWTFEDSEPWVEAWTDGSRDWVIQRVT